MTLKAVLFDFNGVIINDEPLHQKLIAQLLIEENLRPNPDEFWQVCVGRSDRACLADLLAMRGRVVSETYLNELITRKSRAYQQQLAVLENLPMYPGLPDLMFQLKSARVVMAVVSGAVRSEIELVLERTELAKNFSIIVAGDEITASKPDPEGYLLAIKRLNEAFPELQLQPTECLAIEDTFAGLQAAKRAGISVVGVANTYPFHMMQRHANWAVDYLSEIELDRVREVFANRTSRQPVM
ncbi:HAD family phosphatase [Oculatella sp. LEGE 06141]|uniref:HAD family hydrolase n=1 Tax=Oculatella sp. LEGE 06141 TaxID=1828648 RepID=UPI00187E8B3E|nr:HAD family phosphatase [Oculatella sp. LEGE 06141]MBE9180667.1 HAD family phosphatase [Oculatella sp. LEGE 06141]